MTYPYPIIFVHGIQGAWLKNQYPVDYQDEIYWTGVLVKKFGKLHLSTIDSTVDADIDKFIHPHQAVPLVYESVVEELRDEISPQTYVFTYDWRKDNRLSAERLGEFVENILAKAKVHRKRNEPVPKKVALIGHSMGGLVIKWYVTQILKEKAKSRIDRIITIATPYRGSLKAVEALIPGARNFFGLEAQKAMRKASRTLPGVYQLLPAWDKAVTDKKSGKGLDIFSRENWQTSLNEKLEKKYGKSFFQAMLDDAGSFSKVMGKDYKADIRKKFYCIHGTGSKTWKQVKVDTSNGNKFDFKNALKTVQGDGTVHRLSSYVKAVGYHLDDAKYSDMLGGQHAQMPNHGGVQDYIVKILTGNKNIQPFESLI